MQVSFNFAPRGWALCNGQLLPINQNQALFSLLGTTYGGDGRVNFALPNLQGRVALGQTSGFTLGQTGGAETHTLQPGEMGSHAHGVTLDASSARETTNRPAGAYFTTGGAYGSSSSGTPMAGGQTSTASGGGLSHPNMQPFLTLNFIIALQGIFPSPN